MKLWASEIRRFVTRVVNELFPRWQSSWGHNGTHLGPYRPQMSPIMAPWTLLSRCLNKSLKQILNNGNKQHFDESLWKMDCLLPKKLRACGHLSKEHKMHNVIQTVTRFSRMIQGEQWVLSHLFRKFVMRFFFINIILPIRWVHLKTIYMFHAFTC